MAAAKADIAEAVGVGLAGLAGDSLLSAHRRGTDRRSSASGTEGRRLAVSELSHGLHLPRPNADLVGALAIATADSIAVRIGNMEGNILVLDADLGRVERPRTRIGAT